MILAVKKPPIDWHGIAPRLILGLLASVGLSLALFSNADWSETRVTWMIVFVSVTIFVLTFPESNGD
jgi:hypothetical protein